MSMSSNQLEEVQNSSLPLETIVNTHISVEEGDSEAMGTVFWRNKQENIASLRHMICLIAKTLQLEFMLTDLEHENKQVRTPQMHVTVSSPRPSPSIVAKGCICCSII